MSHARLGGSSAAIYLACTAAPSQWVGRQKRPSRFAAEGTLAHEVAEDLLMGFQPPRHGQIFDVDGVDIEFTDDMLAHIKDYTTRVHAARASCDWHAIEQKFTLDALWTDHGETPPEPLFGTADFAGVDDNKLFVMDLKFGKGVLVSARQNPQLLFYALGVWLWLRDNEPKIAAEIENVTVAVSQPRVDNGFSYWTITLLDLLIWGDEVLKRSVDDIAADNTFFKAGAHCRFCMAASDCPELYKSSVAAARDAFSDDLNTPSNLGTIRRIPAPRALSDAELGEALTRAELVNIWLNAVRKETESRIARGHAVAGWKLVEKKALRRFTSERDLALIEARLGLNPDTFFESKMMTPAAGERTLRALGLDPNELASVITTPIAGVTLVPETDERPAANISPAHVFPDDQGGDAP